MLATFPNKAAYSSLDTPQLRDELEILTKRYENFCRQNLALNMARGKPAPEQLDLSNALLDLLPSSTRPLDSNGNDTRNYGDLLGIPEVRELMAQILDVPAAEVLVSGSSSLTLMHDTVVRSLLYGVRGYQPWSSFGTVKFLCPSPGYDRHFAITESLGIRNIEVPMTPDGPEMSIVEQYVQTDSSVKGIWCVPKYSNPEGVTYSDEVVRRFASLRPAAGDFRIFWDNAYAVHDLMEPGDTLLSLRTACKEEDNPDLYYMFASTSKVTFASGGIAALATSADNLEEIAKRLALQNIGPDKVNQLRHVTFLRDLDGVREHMRKQAAFIAPRFTVVLDTLERELGGLDIAQWTRPRGGYFISFDGLFGTAARTVELASAAGVVLTGAGATFPYGVDYRDANIRLAPTYPSLEELTIAS
ncbi:MAG: aminotransferase class I/II-fold pyridoxal phosphate-dependent enzyme, partial [Coriobacteriales bacterium]|nr:aminotransferase class I/II-fold pyridoxal phosphate-dependent enzyme [Coriobacteriales bacterium]